MSKLVSAIVVTRNRARLLRDCLESLLKSTYPGLEVIVVNNGSTDDTGRMLSEHFGGKVSVIDFDRNMFLAEARNAGMDKAGGDFFLFIDDDNIIDPRMVEELVRCMEADSKIGMAGPKMYFHGTDRMLCWTGQTINRFTSQTTYRGSLEKDAGQYDTVSDTEHIPNVVMVRRAVRDQIGGYDTAFRMSYADADYPMRAKAAGFRIVYCPEAVTWHVVPTPGSAESRKRGAYRGIPMRSYYFARNRVVYMKRHSPAWRFLVFFLVFYPLLTIYVAWLIVLRGTMKDMGMHLLGTAHGTWFGITGRLPDYFTGDIGTKESLLEKGK